jgi:hypothetical protein
MNPLRRLRLALEQLECRSCPSLTVSLISGSLYISGFPSGPTLDPNGPTLAITETGTNLFQVKDGTSVLGSYTVPGNILVSLSRRPNNVDVALNASGLRGNLTLNLGAGDTVPPASAIFIHGGRIAGSLSIQKGNGNETFDLGQAPGGITDPLSVGGDVGITAVKSSGIGIAPPHNQLFLFPGSTVSGNLNATFVEGVLLTATSSVGRSVSINDSLETTTEQIVFAGSIGQNATFSGPQTGSFFVASGSIGGNLSANLAGGTNSVSLTGTSLIGGSATLATGAGTGTLNLMGQVSGTLSVNTGTASDTVTFAAAAAVFGDLSLTGGDGANSFTLNGSVAGNLRINLGNGNDTVTVGNAPGGTLFWTSGNGADSLTLAPTTAGQTWNVNVLFGNNDDTFTLAAPGGFLTGKVDGGGHVSGNVFNPDPSWTPTSTFQLVNFP